MTVHLDLTTAAGLFFSYWNLVLLVLCPLAWLAIIYDMNRRREWSRTLKRAYIAMHVMAVVGSAAVTTVYAAEKKTQSQPTIVIQDPCDQYQDLPWWQRVLLGCV